MLKKKYIGALTDKLYAFKNRCWELSITNTVDIYDSLGSNIKVYTYGSEVKRILPLKNDFVNEEWISNKTRYFFEGLIKWRINIPLMRKNNVMIYISWVQAFYYFLLKIWFYSFFFQSKNLVFFNSLFTDYELIVTSKILMKKLGFYSFNKKLNININDYYLYYLNPNFFNEINNKKIFIFVGYNLRLESPILNIKLRKKKIKEEILYFIIGSNFNDNLNCIHLGLNLKNLIMYLQGKLKVCDLVLKRIKKNQTNFNYLQNFFSFNMFLLGNNLINRIDNKNIFNLVYKYINNINLFDLKSNINKKYISGFFFNYCKNVLNFFNNKNLIHSNINILYINLTSILFEEFNNLNSIHNIKKISKNDIFYLLGIDFFKYQKAKFLIFQGHHLNLEYLNVNLIFPSITFFEKSSDFLNIEGSFIQTNFVLYPPVFCRNDWSILNALYIYILNFVNKIYKLNFIKKINYLNVNRFYLQINNVKKIIFYLKEVSVNFFYKNVNLYQIYFYNIMNINMNLKLNKIYNSVLYNKYYNPYKLDIISENSNLLKACSLNFNALLRNYQNITSLYKYV